MKRLKTGILTAILACSALLTAQMPDWKYFRDREGNAYFMDQAGKLHITAMKKFRYRPVSTRGIDYYLEYGSELIRDHHPIEGLSVLKSICALKNDNNRIYQAQTKAADMITRLKKNNGSRFIAMNESASLLIFREDKVIEIINDLMRYSFRAPGRVDIVRRIDRGRLEYRYSGILFGILPSANADNAVDVQGYDLFMAVDTERFGVPCKDLNAAVEKWRGNIGYEGLTREVLAKDDSRLISSFRNSGTPRYAGIEGIILNGVYSHYVRIISSGERYPDLEKTMRAIMEGFLTVRKTD